jgi:hypothetical protein
MGLIRGHSEERLGKCSEIDYISERGVFEVVKYFVLDLLSE